MQIRIPGIYSFALAIKHRKYYDLLQINMLEPISVNEFSSFIISKSLLGSIIYNYFHESRLNTSLV